MRSRLRKFFPIFLVALLVQVLAPIGATWLAALAASDPLSFAEICRTTGSTADQSSDHGAPFGAHSGCPICCLAGAAGTLSDAPALGALAMPYRELSRVVWQDQTADFSVFRVGSNAQARAPPLSS
jgi:hypothetical protein